MPNRNALEGVCAQRDFEAAEERVGRLNARREPLLLLALALLPLNRLDVRQQPVEIVRGLVLHPVPQNAVGK